MEHSGAAGGAPRHAAARWSPWPAMAWAVLSLASACQGGSGAGSRIAVRPAPTAQVMTLPTATQVVAGEAVSVRCQLRRPDGTVVPLPAQVIGPDESRPVRFDSVEATFVPTRAGRAMFLCDGGADGVDPRGAVVEVLPAAPVRVALRQAAYEVAAGTPLVAACVQEDRWGNVCDAAAELWVAPPARATPEGIVSPAQGHVAVRCRAGGFDEAVGGFTVVAGPPAQVRPHLVPAAPQAGEAVSVQCVVEDSCGNARPDVPSGFEVMPPAAHTADGAPAWVPRPQGFEPHLAGTYTVRCQAPGAVGTPMPVSVAAGAPSRWQGAWPTGQDGHCYSQTLELLPRSNVWDRFGNLIVDPVLDLWAEPAQGVRHGAAGGLLLPGVGTYRIHARPRDAVRGVQLPVLSAEVYVDSTPPTVEILTPALGAMLQESDADAALATQTITGTIRDPSGIREIKVNGRTPPDFAPDPAHLPTEFTFSVPREPVWGMGYVQVEAVDGCRNDRHAQRAYLRSPQFAPASFLVQDHAMVPNAVVARLGQPLFDNGRRDATDDLADLMQRALNGERLAGLLPKVLAAWPTDQPEIGLPLREYRCLGGVRKHKPTGYEVTRDQNVVIENPAVTSLLAVDGGWHLALEVKRLSVPVGLHTYADWWCAGSKEDQLAAVLSAQNLRVDIAVEVSKDEAGRPTVAICDDCIVTHFEPGEPRLDVDWAKTRTMGMQHLVAPMLDAAVSAFRRQVQASLQEQLRRDVLSHMQVFVRSWQIERTIALASPQKGGATAVSRIDDLGFTGPAGTGTGTFGMAAQFTPTEPFVHAPALGPIRSEAPAPAPSRQQVAAEPALAPGETFALAVRDDMLNAMLWALWVSGSFDSEALEDIIVGFQQDMAATLEGSHLRLTSALPPVVMPSDRPGFVRVAFGDLLLQVSVCTSSVFRGGATSRDRGPPVPVELELWANLVLDVQLLADGMARVPCRPPEGEPPPAPPREAPGDERAGPAPATPGRVDVTPPAAEVAQVDAHGGTPPVDPRARLSAGTVCVVDLKVAVSGSTNPALEPVGNSVIERWLMAAVPAQLATALGEVPLPEQKVSVIPGVPEETFWQVHASRLSRPPAAQATTLAGTLAVIYRPLPPQKKSEGDDGSKATDAAPAGDPKAAP